jgi:hypothetical protein
MKNLEFYTHNTEKGNNVSENKKEEQLLQAETNITPGLLHKIATSSNLRRAFNMVALSVGLLVGQDALAQQKPEEIFKNTPTENTLESSKEARIEKLLDEFTEYIENSSFFSEYPGSPMSWAAAAEKPTEHQSQQIIDLHNKVSKAAQSQKFKNVTDLMAFVNHELHSDFSSQKAYVNLKDIFPEQENQNPKAVFDCDSRSIMISSILQNIGYTSDDIAMCQMEGHMLMFSKKEGVYFETTTNSILDPTKEQQIQMNDINTLEKYVGHLLSNKGTALALDAESNWLQGRIDKDKIDLAIQTLGQAIELNEDDITSKINLLYLITRGTPKEENLNMASELYQNLLSSLVYKHHKIRNHEQEPVLTLNINPEQRDKKTTPSSFTELSIQAVRENTYIKNKFSDYADFIYYKKHDYQEAIMIYDILLKSLSEQEKTSITADIYRIKIAQAQFNHADFEPYIMEIDSTIKRISSGPNSQHFERETNKLKAQNLVAGILTGRITISEYNIESVVKQYESDEVLGPIISGQENWNINYVEPVETLMGWQGYKELKRLLRQHAK